MSYLHMLLLPPLEDLLHSQSLPSFLHPLPQPLLNNPPTFYVNMNSRCSIDSIAQSKHIYRTSTRVGSESLHRPTNHPHEWRRRSATACRGSSLSHNSCGAVVVEPCYQFTYPNWMWPTSSSSYSSSVVTTTLRSSLLVPKGGSSVGGA